MPNPVIELEAKRDERDQLNSQISALSNAADWHKRNALAVHLELMRQVVADGVMTQEQWDRYYDQAEAAVRGRRGLRKAAPDAATETDLVDAGVVYGTSDESEDEVEVGDEDDVAKLVGDFVADEE